MLAGTLGRWLDENYGFEQRMAASRSALGFDEANWNALAELGVLGLNVPGDYDGLGGSPTDSYVVMQALGRALVVEPYASTAAVAAGLLARAGSGAQRREHLPAIVAGERRFALAALEPQGRFDLHHVGTIARTNGAGFVIDGRKAVVLDGDSAHWLIVSARVTDAAAGGRGIGLFLVPATARGVTRRGFPTIDGRRSAEIEFAGVSVDGSAMIGDALNGLGLLEWAVDRSIAALCAEGVGAMEKLLELTIEHLRARRQFGQPIGKFQALQHKVADMATALDQARSMALLAAARIDVPDPLDRRRALSAAKAIVGRAGRTVGQAAVQLHGGMGMTDEYPVGHFFKRLTCIDLSWGNFEHHVERYGALL